MKETLLKTRHFCQSSRKALWVMFALCIITQCLTITGYGQIVDKRYALIKTFQFTVPNNYDHGHQLDSFAQKNENFFKAYSVYITDTNFARVTQKLVPGKTYLAKIFKINGIVNSKDILLFLDSQSAILVGAQGLSLLQQLKPEKFPTSRWLLSFDKKEALLCDSDGHSGVPKIRRSSRSAWYFYYTLFDSDFDDDCCLLCICDLPLDN